MILSRIAPWALVMATAACGGSTEDGVASTSPGSAGAAGAAGTAGAAGAVAGSGGSGGSAVGGSGGAGSGGVGGSGASGGGGAGAAGMGAGGSGAAGTNACATFVPKATPAEIAKTPRASADAEILAIEASSAFVAPDALYDRVVQELAAIAVMAPVVAVISPMSPVSSAELVVGFDTATYAAYQAGSYHGWDCANAAYGATKHALVGVPSYVTVAFGAKRYNTPLLAKEYKALSGVTSADPNLGGGDGPDVCLEIQGDTHFYIYDQAGGDCPAGCISHLYSGFSAAKGGAVTALGVYDPADPVAEPAWFAALKECRSRL